MSLQSPHSPHSHHQTTENQEKENTAAHLQSLSEPSASEQEREGGEGKELKGDFSASKTELEPDANLDHKQPFEAAA